MQTQSKWNGKHEEKCVRSAKRKLSPKYWDLGSFTISVRIGNSKLKNVILDLRASFNVIPYNIYALLSPSLLKETGIIIQLADNTNINSNGVIEDVIVHINRMIIPIEYYVLDISDDSYTMSTQLLLGKLFMKTIHTKIDV